MLDAKSFCDVMSLMVLLLLAKQHDLQRDQEKVGFPYLPSLRPFLGQSPRHVPGKPLIPRWNPKRPLSKL